MHSINLLPNEGIIAQFDGVGCESPDFKGFERGELTLTNMSLVFTYTQIKMFGKDIDHTFSWALRDIKVVNGKPQLIIDKGDNHQCDILLRKGKIELRMESHTDLMKLANGIVCVGENELQPAKEHFPDKPVIHLPNGVNYKYFHNYRTFLLYII